MNDEPVESSAPSRGDLPVSVQTFINLALVLTAACAFTELVCDQVLHWPYPFTWPLMQTGLSFCDFYIYKPRYAFFHSPQFFSFVGVPYLYPAPMALIYRFFYFFPKPTGIFLTVFAATFVIAAILFWRVLVARGVSRGKAATLLALTFACSQGFFFGFERGNLEFITWMLVASGVWAFLRGRGYTAAACFGIAGAMKFYPLVFLGLLISRKQYRQAVAAVGVAAVTTLISLWVLCPNLPASWRGTEAAIAGFKDLYMLHYREVEFDHSLFALFKAFLGTTKFITHSAVPPGREVLAPMLAVYMPAVALCGIILYFTIIRRLPIVNQVLCLTIASILLPPVSHEYTLIHLYVPWALLVVLAVETRGRIVPGLAACFVCLAIILSPESEFIVYRHQLGAQIKTVTMLVLMVLALRHRFPSSYDVNQRALAT